MTETKSTVLLKHHLATLKLPTIKSECESMAAQCARDNVDHLGYLHRLCERELLDRERKASDRRLKAARFPSIKTLDAFDFSVQPSLNKPMVVDLMRCEYIENRENILLVGNPGAGKTHLATALGVEACAKAKKVRFFRLSELVTQLLEAQEQKALGRMKSQIGKLDLLILDELGYVPASKKGAELLFDIISHAYERTSIVITTNLPFEQWSEVFGCERMTGAAIDRLTHRCHILEASGESYRLKDSQRRRKIERRGDGKASGALPPNPRDLPNEAIPDEAKETGVRKRSGKEDA
jgi:DNA replication protein DnaC